MPESKPKRRWFLFGLATLWMLAVFFAAGWVSETLHADREAVQSIEKGMTHAEVVDLLGVMYDDYHLGQYARGEIRHPYI